LIKRFDLMDLYRAKFLEDARLKLDKSTNITDGKDNIISVEVMDRNPQRAADIANAYVDELRQLNQDLGMSEASQRRMFFDRELEQAKDKLSQAEVNFKQMQQKTGIIELQGQTRGMIMAAADLQAQIAAIDVQIKGMESFATAENPDLLRARQERAELQNQLAKIETAQGPQATGDVLVPTGKVPQAGLEYVRRLREVKYYETLFELLARQTEAAKLDEAKESVTIEVMDAAMVPERRSSPKRSLIVILATIFGMFLSVTMVFFIETAERMRANPESAGKLELLKSHIRRRTKSAMDFTDRE
jgi:uncharacterized protein involved in exopolysaccharide biosynthesis